MSNSFEKGLFIFRRDLRVHDNISLISLANECEKIICCFIFTPEQVSSSNKYKSDNAVQFMIESLIDLDQELKKKGSQLYCFYGNQYDIINELVISEKVDKIMFNADYSPYAKKRDNKIKQLCITNNIDFNTCNDYYLHEPGSILVSSTNKAYKKYTPFYNKSINCEVKKSLSFNKVNTFAKIGRQYPQTISLTTALSKFTTSNPNILVHGGRTNGIKRLMSAIKEQDKYLQTRDTFSMNTSHLSAYIKFGCVSIREVYFSFYNEYNKHHGLISELYWREFFAHVLHGYPEVVGQSYQEKYRTLKWVNNKTHIKKWKEGNTGFPIVDAAMRELNTTGYMHNRGRMITASTLIKTLRIDWRIGEKYFATKLTDYDIASNNGNWQGISGTGVDMKPYFRDMNPFIQSKQYDPDCEYIKKWIPELKNVPVNDIHTWFISHKKNNVNYPPPIVNYNTAKKEMIKMYSSI